MKGIDGDIRKLKAIMTEDNIEPKPWKNARCYFCYLLEDYEVASGTRLLTPQSYSGLPRYYEAFGDWLGNWNIIDSNRRCSTPDCDEWLTMDKDKCERHQSEE
jgi:hypothetical protein